MLNQIWPTLSPLINLFTPQQKLISKTRTWAKVTKRYDPAQTPYQRLLSHPDALDAVDSNRLATQHQATNPAQARRDIGQLCATLLERIKRKNVTTRTKNNRVYLSKTKINKSLTNRASSNESTTHTKRAS